MMKIKAHFVGPKADPFQLIKWKKSDCEIRSQKGDIVFAMKNVEAPAHWSSLAVDIAASKYFRKGVETSVRQLISRVVQAIQNSGLRQKYFKDRKESKIFAQELAHILLHQKAFFNSPVWFNCGLFEKYKIKGDLKLWAWDEKSRKIKLTQHSFERPQVSACFIQKIEDNIESIFDLCKKEALLFKFGSGSGTNFSNLRSKYEKIDGGGTSSGLLSFLDFLDRGAASVKSGGTTRRAAKMVILDADHPEIEDFVEWKAREEKKAKALIAAGFDGAFEGEAYRTVSGQNANNSVRVTDTFMRAVAAKKPWPLLARVKGDKIKTVQATDLWQKIGQAAWDCADPGLQFHDTINAWHTCPETDAIHASNPCSEYMFLDDSACNLASLNLLSFLQENGSFDFAGYLQTVQVMTLAQEILVDYAGYPTETIAQNSHDFRPLGLGFCGLGAFLMRQGLAYDSAAGREWAAVLASLLTAQAYGMSAEIAKSKKSFPGFSKNKKSMLSVIEKHAKASASLKTNGAIPKEIFSQLKQLWSETLALGKKQGFRNSQISLIAPTGTIGLVLDCETTGIEPEFALIKTKKMSGGGVVQIASESVRPALKKLGYSESVVNEALQYLQDQQTLEGFAKLKSEHLAVFDSAVINGSQGTRFIRPEGHLQMMAALQPLLSGAISKTVNLPETSTVADILDVYQKSWELGLKSIAIYRDSSKGAQPLVKKQKWQSPVAADPTQFPPCPDCGSVTELAGGCFRCPNCGTSLGCS